MSIRVGELVSHLRSHSRVITTRMGDVELVIEGPEAGMLRVGDDFFPWGNRNTQTLAGFFQRSKSGFPGYKYLLGESLGWQRSVVEHHVTKVADSESVWHIQGSSVEGIYQPDAKMIPLVSYAEQIADVFDPDDEANVLHSPDQVELNVLSRVRTVEVPGILGVESRPMAGTLDYDGIRVGDLSRGGVRIIVAPGKPERGPSAEEFWERFACTNGLTRRVSGSQISLRGRTVDEILLEMNNIMRSIWEGLEGSGQAILHSAQTPIPGATSDFIRVVARERKINAATVLRLQERAASLPANPTVYDVTQVFTAMANEDGVSARTRRDLQAAGGDLTIDTDRMIHRCNACERPLVDA